MPNPSDTDSNLADPSIIELVAERLQELRKRLLDASRRNPLVSIPFRPNSTNILRVVDELPDVLRFNLASGTSMRLVALPALEVELPDEQTDAFLDALYRLRNEDEEYLAEIEALDSEAQDFEQMTLDLERALKDRLRADLGLPQRQTKEKLSLAEHAKAHGVSPSYSLPVPEEEHEDGRHNDTDIQTLILPDKLSRVAKGILEKGRGFERETGVNVLHVAFGLLEWKSPDDRDNYVSPLLLMEIRITRKQSPRGSEFHLVGEGSISVNTTLKQKLFSEHRLDLPEYISGSVENYFAEVADAAPPGWEWSVRREVAIGIFPSSKIAMYHDLDPAKRPVAENEVIGRLLATSGSGKAAYADVYSTDDPEITRKVPYLVMDADASQYSALVDVADGAHVSIEGPPGSGKSQTIVNLIAAALADNKKVLFAAEKLTALDVVKNRLEAASLGEFILPLQAGRGTKEKIYNSLEERLSMGQADEDARRKFASRRGALEQRLRVLQDYLDALSADFGSSGYSVYDVIGYGITTSDDRDSVPKAVRRISVPDCERLGMAQIETIISDAESLAERLGRVNRMPAFWLDSAAMILNRDDAEDVCESLDGLAGRMEAFICRVAESMAAPLIAQDPFAAGFPNLLDLLHKIETRGSEVDPDMVERLSDPAARLAVQDLCSQIRERRTLTAQLMRHLKEPEAWNLLDQMRSALSFAKTQGDIIDPLAHSRRIEEIRVKLEDLYQQHSLAADLPGDWAARTERPLSVIHGEASRLVASPDHALAFRRADPKRVAGGRAEKLKEGARDLSEKLGYIQQALPHAGKHAESHLRRAAATIANAGMFRFMSGEFKAARNYYVNILGGSAKDDRKTMVERLKAYADWLGKERAFAGDADFWQSFGETFVSLSTNLNKIDEMVALHNLCDEISDGDTKLYMALEEADLSKVENFVEYAGWSRFSLSELKVEIELLKGRLTCEEALEKAAGAHRDLFTGVTAVPQEAIADMLQCKEREQELTVLIERSEAADVIGDRFAGTRTLTETLIVECSVAELVAGAADPVFILSALKSGAVGSLVTEVADLTKEREAIDAETASISLMLQLPEDLATPDALSARLSDLRAAAADPSGLMERARLRRSEDMLRDQGFGKLVDWVLLEGEAFDPARLAPIVRSIIAKSMADRAYEIHDASLRGSNGADFDRIRAEFVEKDRLLIRMSREVVRNHLVGSANPPSGNSIGRKSTFTEMSLIRNEMGKKRNQIGVRELTRRAGRALLELKPCWMMSPLAVANYLHDGMTFDLVVIDEASQMTPENAIGALSRARQAVVVGDTKQLPPTSFFQKILDDGDVDEDLREDSESVLDMANMAFRPVRQLRWHYRSRHSALIRFSNEWMYDGKLTIFPSAREDDPEFGVHLEEVPGIYKGRTNQIEARAIVTAVVAHMRDAPDLSLGVCTMNSDQKELIREEFERELERNHHVQAYVREWQERNDSLEEFFIKNLETIQGDERDVMFISTLYGPEAAGGRPHQRFGPINSAHGHRRLNVLFTRAKRKIVTFTSLRPTDILVNESKNRGVQMFRAWLEYCATGNIPDKADTGGGEAENPFEDYVITQIEALGCEAVPQVGAAGYRIDIGVRHPDWPYGYLLGVECDGASYHSSSSSRDRDRLRQEVLEGLGWRFHRIWSTDWFNDTRTQVERLKEAIDAALEAAQAEQATKESLNKKTVLAKRPEEENLESARGRNDTVDVLLPDEPAAQTRLFDDEENANPETPASVKLEVSTVPAGANGTEEFETIRLGSNVKIENLSEKGRMFAFTLVNEGNDLDNGKLSVHAPLGSALIDCQVGDTIEYQVGVEIKEVRILEVT
ncbi:DUF4011 domain-containing protein [Pararhizobium sp. IMCC21322]|uniref:DUF4011 domain-containing protein n=1 Tax=Pararhizobium sp. IMCC21322 TaxID=3067903 RepID=UPI0027420221|nr:DUF4011 domain-containing protein [Pararhizobium sp. IMCC21322]